jgi:hypothetical protein
VDLSALEQNTPPNTDTHVKHTFPLLAGLSLWLSLVAGTSALGQSNPGIGPDRAQGITVPMSPRRQERRDGTIGTLSLWLANGQADRLHRWTHPSFRIRLGRGFSITVPQR